MPEEEKSEQDIINAARMKLRALKDPIGKSLRTYKSDPQEFPDPSLDPRIRATANVLNSLDVLADTYVPHIDTLPDYRGLVMAAIAYIDPRSEFHLETPTIFRKQSVGLNYSNIVQSDPTISAGIDLITKRVKHAEEADLEARGVMVDLNTRVNEGIDILNTMPISLGPKR
jgi:hypothetical protein